MIDRPLQPESTGETHSDMYAEILACAVDEVSKSDDGTYERSFRFPETFAGFDGHFPGQPILPAIVQLLMGQITITEHADGPIKLVEVRSAKFREMLKPDQLICLRWTEKPCQDRIEYKVKLSIAQAVVVSFTLVGEKPEATAHGS